jgi:hypothetical protein
VNRESVWVVFDALLRKFMEWDMEEELTDELIQHPGYNTHQQPISDDHQLIPLTPGLAELPYGADHPIDDEGSFYLGGRPDAFMNLREVDQYDDEEPGIPVDEIPIMEVELTDPEDDGTQSGNESTNGSGFLF